VDAKIRTIDDVVDYTKRNCLPGILIATDFEKAFDTLDFNFLIRTLHKFNFGPSFLHWIRTLYKDVSSAVMNNGFTTRHFSLERGVRQGDPLSPYLFIIAVEILAIKIREDNNIQGFKIGQEVLKLSSFADDMTCFLKDNFLYNALFKTLALGNSILQDVDFPKHNITANIKILGVYFGYDVKQRDALHFRQTLKT